MFSSKKMFKAVFGAVLAAGLLLTTSDAQPLDVKKKVSIVEQKKWAVGELSMMAKSMTMEYAVSSITSAVRETRAPTLQLDEIKELIDVKSAAELRTALLTATGAKNNNRKTKDDQDIADFANTIDPAAMCASEDTAGGHGLDICVAGCDKKSYYLGWQSRKGACHMLCTVATSPCTTKSRIKATVLAFSSRTMETAKIWGETAEIWGTAALEWIERASFWAETFGPVLVAVVCQWYFSFKFGNGRTHPYKEKGAVLVKTHDRLEKRKAFNTLHEFAARASQEAAAKAKALRLQAAIDEVAAEQGIRDEGVGGACVLS